MKTIVIALVVAGAFIVGGFLLSRGNTDAPRDPSAITDNVQIIDGKQIITISAKGGYSPQMTVAKSGISTVLKVETKGTFDCSSALTIPSLNYRNNLPPSGETVIDVPPQEVGAKLQGLCAMGMYNFSITFN